MAGRRCQASNATIPGKRAVRGLFLRARPSGHYRWAKAAGAFRQSAAKSQAPCADVEHIVAVVRTRRLQAQIVAAVAEISLLRPRDEEYVAPAPAALGIVDLEPDAVGIVAHLLQQQAVALALAVVGRRGQGGEPAARREQGRARSRVALDEPEHRAVGCNADQLAPVRRRADARLAAVADRDGHDLAAAEREHGLTV